MLAFQCLTIHIHFCGLWYGLCLHGLIENLSAVGCCDQNKKVADYITSKEPPGEELVQAVPGTAAEELHIKPEI